MNDKLAANERDAMNCTGSFNKAEEGTFFNSANQKRNWLMTFIA